MTISDGEIMQRREPALREPGAAAPRGRAIVSGARSPLTQNVFNAWSIWSLAFFSADSTLVPFHSAL